MTRQQDRGGGGGQRLRVPNAPPVQRGGIKDIEESWERAGWGSRVYTDENLLALYPDEDDASAAHTG